MFAASQQRAGKKPRKSKRCRALVEDVRGFLRIAVGRGLNRLVKQGEPKGLILERLDFRNLNLSRQIARDRLTSFDPQLIVKCQRRFPGFDDKIVSMYARGMSTREIQGHLRELYALEVPPALVGAVTDAVLEEFAEWQNRPLAPLYPIVFLDALRVKLREEGTVRNKAVCVALGVRADGTKEVLGLWIEQTEGAKFWLRVMNKLRDRGVQDILIAVVDGLKGFPEAIGAVFPP